MTDSDTLDHMRILGAQNEMLDFIRTRYQIRQCKKYSKVEQDHV